MNIEQIKAKNGTVYDVADKTARETLATKQIKLIAGRGIKIEGNRISLIEGGSGSFNITFNSVERVKFYEFERYANLNSVDYYYYVYLKLDDLSVWATSTDSSLFNKVEIGDELVRIDSERVISHLDFNEQIEVDGEYFDYNDDFHIDFKSTEKTETIDEIIPNVKISSVYYEAPQGKAVKSVELPFDVVEIPMFVSMYSGNPMISFDGNVLKLHPYIKKKIRDGRSNSNDGLKITDSEHQYSCDVEYGHLLLTNQNGDVPSTDFYHVGDVFPVFEKNTDAPLACVAVIKRVDL